MSQVLRKELRFGGSLAVLEFKGPKACAVGSFMFSAWPESSAKATPHYRLVQKDQTLHLWRREKRIRNGDDPAVMGEAMQAKVAFDLADKSNHGMVLHAACLSNDDAALLIPAASGSGKSTLTTWLARQGLGFLCDDVVYVPQGLNRVVPLIRPVQLKGRSRVVLKPWFDWEQQGDRQLCGPTFCLTPPEIIGPPVRWRFPRIKRILFPKYEAGAEFHFEELSTSQTGLYLMECLVNARNLSGHGLNQAIHLAGMVRGYRLQYSDFSQLEPVCQKLLPKLGVNIDK